MMKTSLLTILCSTALALAAAAQDPNATPNPATAASPALEAAPTASPAVPSAPVAKRSPARADDDSLEARIERKVRRHVQISVGDGDDEAKRRRHDTDTGDSDFEELGPIMAIPIVGIIFTTLFGAPVLIVGLIMFFSYWKARSLHRTVRMMVEKGQPVPAELFAAPHTPAKARSDMRRGVVLMAVGLGIMVFLGAISGWSEGAWALGMIPFLIGAGYLTVWKLEGHRPALYNTSSDNPSSVS